MCGSPCCSCARTLARRREHCEVTRTACGASANCEVQNIFLNAFRGWSKIKFYLLACELMGVCISLIAFVPLGGPAENSERHNKRNIFASPSDSILAILFPCDLAP